MKKDVEKKAGKIASSGSSGNLLKEINCAEINKTKQIYTILFLFLVEIAGASADFLKFYIIRNARLTRRVNQTKTTLSDT